MNLLKNHSFLHLITKVDLNSVRTHYSRLIAGKKPAGKVWPFENKKWPDGEKYYKFTYYPRYPDQVDPQWKATPLFMVKRVKNYSGTPWPYKKILRMLRIEQTFSEKAIVINCPQNNAMLWKIKHLVEILPITFPDGVPTEEDIPNCHLHENGELRISKDLAPNTSKFEATETFQKKVDLIEKKTIEKYTRKKWLDAIVNIHEF